MRNLAAIIGLFIQVLCSAGSAVSEGVSGGPSDSLNSDVSFKRDVMSIVRRQCLPCHAEDNLNPSELSLDSRKLLMEGGKHGVPVIPGNAEKSLLYQKLGPSPPFGKRMPLDPKKKKGMASTKSLTEEEIRVIREWIEQGAKDN